MTEERIWNLRAVCLMASAATPRSTSRSTWVAKVVEVCSSYETECIAIQTTSPAGGGGGFHGFPGGV